MEKITSFTIDHIRLQPGLYVSRKDKVGTETITTFDLRLTSPNEEPVMNTAEIHTMEHLAATYLRNDAQWKEKVLYFGPMGCRTGFYLLLAGDHESRDVLELVKACFRFIAEFSGEVPGASAKDCGNYLDQVVIMSHTVASQRSAVTPSWRRASAMTKLLRLLRPVAKVDLFCVRRVTAIRLRRVTIPLCRF